MNLAALPGLVLDGKYRIERLLGRGGMGAVFVAVHLGTTRTVAVKVIVPQLAGQEEFLLRFQREAEAAGRLRHPNVVNVTDFGFTSIDGGQLAYLVMEYLDGETLAGFLKKNPKPPVDLILDIVDQVALGLDAAHASGIVHRDLKPDNVWLESNRRGGYNVKVLDFGIAKLDQPVAPAPLPRVLPIVSEAGEPESETQVMPATAVEIGKAEASTIASPVETPSNGRSLPFTTSSSTSLQTTVGSVLGTPAFMAPEQCQGAVVDYRADIYSFAVIAYLLFCGRLPFDARNFRDLLDQQIKATPPAPRELDKSIPQGVSDTILRGLAKDPSDRQNSAATLAAQLRAGAEGEIGPITNGKVSVNNLNCYGPLLLACFVPLFLVNGSLLAAAAGVAHTRLISATAVMVLMHLSSFSIHFFVSQAYKAGSSMMFEDALAAGYFRPQLRSIMKRLFAGTGPMLGIFLRSAVNPAPRSFLDSALWPLVWASEGLTARAALDRAGALAATQPAATGALLARQYGIILMAALWAPATFVTVTGSFSEYASRILSLRLFSWYLALFPAYLSIFFLRIGPAFDFLYLSARRCLGEPVPSIAPSNTRRNKSGASRTVRPATMLWLAPATLMTLTIVYHLFPHPVRELVLLDAAEDDRSVSALKAIDSGTPVDTRDGRDRTPLMFAAMNGDLDFLRQLLDRGANVNARMNDRSTPLIFAVSGRHLDTARLLLDHQADVRASTTEGRTSLMIAAIRGDAELCRLLLSHGADAARRDDSGKSALDYANEEGHQEVVTLLSGR